jgi:squalene/oxidosqualene cyclase-like protein
VLGTTEMGLGYLVHIWNAIAEVFRYLFDMYVLKIPVSYPGDALENQQSRIGEWSSEVIHALGGWEPAVDAKSHEHTNKEFPKYPLTGESAGRQTWHLNAAHAKEKTEHTFCAAKNPNSGDKIFRGAMIQKWRGAKPDEKHTPATAKDAVAKGYSFFQMIQTEDGHWAGDYGGPMFLMPGLICVLYLSKAPFPPGRREGMIAYLKNHQQKDGGWGTHIECASTMFGTILSYIALRLLGVDADEPQMVKGREFIHKYGGALYAPSWAKFWMAVIGVYEWEGINSIPVEMWLLPRWFPFHPGKLWCHCRMVYLPMGYLYCKQYKPDVENDPILSSLRKELYVQNYNKIDWDAFRQKCAPIDEYSPLNPIMKVAQDFLSYYEKWLPKNSFLKRLRQKGLEFAIDYIHAEDKQTNFIDIGPVNKALNMMSVFVDSGCNLQDERVQRHLARVEDYLWVAEDGMKMQGYNGSQAWDTAFATQGIIESGLVDQFHPSILSSYQYFNRSQIKDDEDNRDYYYRHISKGGWPFSTAAHGWPISDCTAEGLKSVLAVHATDSLKNRIPSDQQIAPTRLYDSINVLLSYQNTVDGGWATYENNRGYRWYELLNPSEVFGDIMIDYSYVECSSASITAMKAFHLQHPEHRTEEVLSSIARGRDFLKSIQRRDGSWYGSWGNCFTYGTWFGVEGLLAAGEPVDSDAIQRSVKFLLSKQNANGGWGENYLACVNKVYPADGAGAQLGDGGSGIVQTAWALLTLMKANCSEIEVIRRGIKFLMQKQVRNLFVLFCLYAICFLTLVSSLFLVTLW